MPPSGVSAFWPSVVLPHTSRSTLGLGANWVRVRMSTFGGWLSNGNQVSVYRLVLVKDWVTYCNRVFALRRTFVS